MKGGFVGNRPGPAFGLNTALTAPTQPCIDETNSYHPERCDRARCDKPWCKRGEARRQVESVAQESPGERVTIRCGRCGATLSHMTYYQVVRLARRAGWIVAADMRICPDCQGGRRL